MDAGATDSNARPAPDGGRRGWIAVLTLWTSNAIWVGITKGLGIMLPTLRHQLDTQTWIIGWITSMVVVMTGVMGKYFTQHMMTLKSHVQNNN